MREYVNREYFKETRRAIFMKKPVFDPILSGEQLRQIREEKGIKVKEVAEYMGFLSTQAIYKWEKGKCFPQADNLIALALLYDVNPADLLVEKRNNSDDKRQNRRIEPAVA